MVSLANSPKVQLGPIRVTTGVMDALGERARAQPLLNGVLVRMQAGDWGDVTSSDAEANEADLLANQGRLLGVYHLVDRNQKRRKIYCATHLGPEGYTVVLLPEEY